MWIWLVFLSILSTLEVALEPVRCIYLTWNSEKPVRVFAPPPEYPETALSEKLEGRVLVEGIVAPDGSIESASLIAFEPSDVFNEAALDAFRSWRYCPLAEEIDPKVRVSIVFKLDKDQ